MREIRFLVLTVLFITLMGAVAFADDSDFVIDANGVLTEYKGSDAHVVIPDGVKVVSGNSVLGAFDHNLKIKSVKIPDSVTVIDSGAFAYCKNLKDIDIPNSVIEIGNAVFTSCDSLENIKIPDSVKSIGNNAFAYCGMLRQVELGTGIDTIGKGAFKGCRSLKNINLPSKIKIIEQSTFYGCKELLEIKIPNGVKKISGDAFTLCVSLESIEMPNSVTEIGGTAFSACTALREIYIPKQVVVIDDTFGAIFAYCDNLTIYGEAGSKAQEMAKKYNIPFVVGTLSAPSTAPSSWAKDFVDRADSLKLIPPNLKSSYTKPVNRAEFAALAVQAYETIKGKSIAERKTFNDTTDVNVQKAGALGIVSGTGNGNFSPTNAIKRQEAAVMLNNLLIAVGKEYSPTMPSFVDNDSMESWAKSPIGIIQANGIMGGVGDNKFDPKGNYTREQSIITMVKVYDIVK